MVELGAKMLADAPPVGRHWASDAPSPPTNFYSGFRRLTLTAYYTSEAGATKELHFEVIPDQYQGCNITSETKKSPKQP